MATEDIERIYSELRDIKKEQGEMKAKQAEMSEAFAVHCAKTTDKPTWKVYLTMFVVGAMVSRGPEFIPILAKWVGIGV